MFVKTISKYLNGYDMSITLRKNDDGTITAIMVPKLKADQKDSIPIPPLSITASPEYFDTEEFLSDLKDVLVSTEQKIKGINYYDKILTNIEEKKKAKVESKSTTKANEKTISKTVTKNVPNPEYIAPEERTEDNEDYDVDTYDEDTPEFIQEKVVEQVNLQKTLI